MSRKRTKKITGDALIAATQFLLNYKKTQAVIQRLEDEYLKARDAYWDRQQGARYGYLKRIAGPLEITVKDLETGRWVIDMNYLAAHGDAYVYQQEIEETEDEVDEPEFEPVEGNLVAGPETKQ